MNFQPILDCFIAKFKLEYNDSENIKTDRVNAVVFTSHLIKRLKFFLGHLAESHSETYYEYNVEKPETFDEFGNLVSERNQMRKTMFLPDISKVNEFNLNEERAIFPCQSVKTINPPFYAS